MKGYQMTKKKEPKYIGRYGEEIQNVKIEGFCDKDGERVPEGKANHILITGMGRDAKGRKAKVRFTVLKKNHIKDGMYEIRRKISPGEFGPSFDKGSLYIEDSRYLNGRLHGEEEIWVRGTASVLNQMVLKRIYWRQSKKRDSDYLTESRYEEIRDGQAEYARGIRKLLEDASVVKAVKTGDPVKVRNATARAAMKIAKEKGVE